MDASSAAYLSATAVLVLAELRALITKDNDDTITHKVKASTPLHAAMVSLLTWGLYHFTLEDEIGNPGAAAGVAVAVAGGLLGFWVSRRRQG